MDGFAVKDTLAPAALAARIAALPAADMPAVRLYLELAPAADALDEAAIEKRHDEIERAIDDLRRQIEKTHGIVNRCQQLTPIPSRQVPDGI